MARQSGTTSIVPAQGRFADVFVIFSVTVLSMALGAWFLVRMGMTLWPGMAAALTIYAVLLMFHLLVRRSLIEDKSDRLEDQSQWVPGESELGRDPFEPEAVPQAEGLAAETGRDHAEARAEAASGRFALPEASAEVEFHYRPREAGTLFERALEEVHAGPVPAPQPTVPATKGAPVSAADRRGSPPVSQPQSPSEKNVELIQDLIKKLADELSDLPAAPPPGDAVPGEAEDAMIARSLAALDTAASSMRAAGVEQKDEGIAAWWPATDGDSRNTGTAGTSATRAAQTRPAMATKAPPLPNPQVARVAEAVVAGRMDVFLEPVQALNEGRARHFEISTRLLAADGAAIDMTNLHRAGMVPRMDAARVTRVRRVADRLAERGREGTVLTAIAGESLTDPYFLEVAAAHGADTRGMGLTLSVNQGLARSLTEAQVRSLTLLRSKGYRFALQDVVDLNMDLRTLRTWGFQFISLEAPVFLEGLGAAGNRVAASDLCRYLGDFGLTLIVRRIEDDWMLARVLGFGVQLGMGGLFGGPKLVKAEVVGEPAAA